METLLPVKESQVTFKQALVCEIELIDGRQTQAILLFNTSGHELNFEELNFGIEEGLRRCHDVRRCKNTLCGLKTGKFKPYVFFHENVCK